MGYNIIKIEAINTCDKLALSKDPKTDDLGLKYTN
jgi:hypothetical protein